MSTVASVAPKQPSEKDYNAAIAENDALIKAEKEQMQKISSLLDNAHKELKKLQEEQTALQTKAKAAAAVSKTVADERAAYMAKVDAKKKEKRDAIAELTEMRANLPFTQLERIDEEVARLEHHQVSSSLTLQEEKSLLSEINRLKHSRELVGKYQSKEEALKKLGESITEMIAGGAEVKAKEAAQRKITDAEFALVGPVRERRQKLFDRIKEIKKERSTHWEKIHEVEASSKKLGDEYFSAKREFVKYDKARKHAEWEARGEERAKRAIEEAKERRAGALEAATINPNAAKIAKCTELEGDLKTLLPRTEETEQHTEKEQTDGVMGKARRVNDADLALLAGGKKKGKRTRNRVPVLHLSFGALNRLMELGLTAPKTIEEVKAVLEEIAAKKTQFEQEGDAAKEERVAKLKAQFEEEDRKAEEKRVAAAMAEKEAAAKAKEEVVEEKKAEPEQDVEAEQAPVAEEVKAEAA